MWISGASYDNGISPSGVHDITGFVQRFGEPRKVHLVNRDGQTYYEVIGGVHPKFTLTVPSNSPRYIFDDRGKFVAWCSGLGEVDNFDAQWPLTTDDALPFSTIKQKLGL